ncbi:hypothetical protein [Halanaerobaculum tunisiense]
MLWISASITLLGVLIFYYYWLREEEETEEGTQLETADYDLETSDELNPTTEKSIKTFKPETDDEANDLEASEELAPKIEVLHKDED